MFHIGGIGWAFLGLWNGATTVLVSEFVAEDVLDLLERQRVTNAVFVPTMLQMLTAGARRRRARLLRAAVDRLRRVADHDAGAEGGAAHVRLLALRRLRPDRDDGRRRQLDPPTTIRRPREHLLRSAGRPFPWVELRIVDPDGRDSAGEVGEVWLRAPNVMPGYFNRPERPRPRSRADGWLRTGDGGYLDEEGYLFLTDRIKDMIVSGGENVYPIEVEEALVAAPGRRRGRRDRRARRALGRDRQGARRRAPGARRRADELVAFARERLAGYKLPRSVEFVDELPRTPTGKVLKHELRERYP